MDPMEHPPVMHETEAAQHPALATHKRLRRRDGHAEYLEERLRSVRDALRAATQGNFSVRLPIDGGEEGMMGEVSIAFNVLLEQNAALAREVDRVSASVSREGNLEERVTLGPVSG